MERDYNAHHDFRIQGEVSHDHSRKESINISDIENDISDMRHRVTAVLASSALVHAIFVIPTVNGLASPVCSTPKSLEDIIRWVVQSRCAIGEHAAKCSA